MNVVHDLYAKATKWLLVVFETYVKPVKPSDLRLRPLPRLLK